MVWASFYDSFENKKPQNLYNLDKEKFLFSFVTRNTVNWNYSVYDRKLKGWKPRESLVTAKPFNTGRTVCNRIKHNFLRNVPFLAVLSASKATWAIINILGMQALKKNQLIKCIQIITSSKYKRIAYYWKFVKSIIIGAVAVDGVCGFKTSKILLHNNNFEVCGSRDGIKSI